MRTQDYVPVDWVTVRILREGTPLANGSLALRHKSYKISIQLDANGSVTFPVGDACGFRGWSNYLTVEVQGGLFNITSYGEGRSLCYTYDLSSKSLVEEIYKDGGN
ncbi:MAG: hypothetical protein ABC585_06145 [Candidatus Methanosuratincola petrocarbonis]